MTDLGRLGVASLCLFTAWMGPANADSAIAPSATLTIRIGNVNPQGGMLRLGLYDVANYANDVTPAAAADVPAQPGVTTITLTNLKPGIYAIETFQDLNSNGKMDKSWFGLPLEPFGFSRDAKPHLHKPHFAAVQFTLNQGENVQSLNLQTSISLIAAE